MIANSPTLECRDFHDTSRAGPHCRTCGLYASERELNAQGLGEPDVLLREGPLCADGCLLVIGLDGMGG